MKKDNVDGYSHFHVFVDIDMSMMMDMGGAPKPEMMATPEGTAGMAMPGLSLMPGTETFELALSACGPGEHTIWIEPARNDHHFESFDHVEFTVTVEEEEKRSDPFRRMDQKGSYRRK